jgi:hypothetical protein
MKYIRSAALIFAILNLVGGLLSFAGPLVSCNNDRGINTKPGLLFGKAAINWMHGAMHILLGILGLLSFSFNRFEQDYLRLNAGVFSGLAALGWTTFGMRKGIYMKMGLALNWVDNIAHSAVALAVLPLALVPASMLSRRVEWSDGKQEVLEETDMGYTSVELV